MAQLAINRLPLPEDIHFIIKEYAFLSIERKRIMQIKKQIGNKIIYADKDAIITHVHFNRWWFKAEGEPSMYCVFCKNCGDYIYTRYISSVKLCQC